jgi:D-glutamate cyclase
MDEALLILGDSVDHLVTTDVKWPNAPLGHIRAIHEACRNLVGGSVCLAAAEAIQKKVNKDSTVIISSGFLLPPFFPLGETDGPLGAVALARAISQGIGARVVLITETELMEMLHATCLGGGVSVYSAEDYRNIPGGTMILDFTRDKNRAVDEADRILKEIDPSAVITVEKIGRNEKGVYHTARGSNMDQYVSGVDLLVEEAERRGILTIGIGDLGNEIGLGRVGNVVKSVIGPLGMKCNCGCGGGIVTKVGTEIPIIATTSNWGAYGVVACLGALLRRSDILHSAHAEKRMLEECTRAGGKDGAMVSPTLSCDGISVEGNQGIVQLLQEIVRVKLAASTPYRK